MNITYHKNTNTLASNEPLKFPKSIMELNETIDELDKRFTPIKDLRKAKEELLASNINEVSNFFFRRK